MALSMSRPNWVEDDNKATKRSKAEQKLNEVKKERKGKFRLVKVDEKTWKEVPIDE